MKHNLPKQLKNFPHNLSNFNTGLFWVFATWGVYFLWLWSRMIFYRQGTVYAGWYKQWADWSAHYTIAAVFKYRNPADWFTAHPLFIDSKFTYPFLPDAITGLFWRLGLSEVSAFLLTSLLYTFLMLYVMYLFYFTLTKTAKKAFLSISFVILSGGLGFFWYFTDYFLKTPVKLADLEFTNLIDQASINFINITTSELIPQRAFLLGIPITLIILLNLVKYQKALNYKVAIFLGLCASLLIFIHVHSLITVIVISAVFFLYNVKNYKFYILYAITAAVFLTPVYYLFYHGEISQSFFRWYPGWLSNPDKFDVNFIKFWVLNWGLIIPLFVVAFVKYKLYKNSLIVGAVLVFTLSNLFLFQPHDWDNTKLLTYVYIIAVYPISILLADIFKKGILYKLLTLVLIFMLTFSGFLDLARLGTQKSLEVKWWDQSELQCANQINNVIESGDVVAIGDMHTHIVATHTKAQIIVGFTGWLWTYGINYMPQITDMQTFYLDPYNKQIIDKYNIKYAYVGDFEKDRFKTTNEIFAGYPIVVNCGQAKLYKIQ